jgi:DNA ligase-1
MPFKPMLATAIEDTSTLKFPVLASIKLDGIRATMQGGQLLSRTLKPIPNKQVQEMFKNLPEGIDGELIYGDPAHKDCYRTTTSIVMSHDKDATGIVFYAFDTYSEYLEFQIRLASIAPKIHAEQRQYYIVHHQLIRNEEELLAFEADALELGHEGVMVRSLCGPYKQGRSSLKEGHLLKLKRFRDAEAVITGFYEEMENTNEAKTNALGRTERSSAKEGMLGKGTLGGFEVEDVKTGVAFQIGGGFTAEMRKDFWKRRKQLIGDVAKYKYFPTGSKERPRFPVFLGFRDREDM